jgi:hypothetical protein
LQSWSPNDRAGFSRDAIPVRRCDFGVWCRQVIAHEIYAAMPEWQQRTAL